MSNAAKSAITVSAFHVYEDASGANALVECGGYVFSCNWIGRYTATLIKPVSGTRRQNEIAARRVEVEFTHRVMAETTPEWREACAKMYADE